MRRITSKPCGTAWLRLGSLRQLVGPSNEGEHQAVVDCGTVRFLHSADWQLGMTRRWLTPRIQGRYDDARLAAVAALGRVAREQGAEFVVVAGDVFDHVQVEPRTAASALRALEQIGLDVFLLPGNHDHLSAAGVYSSRWFGTDKPGNVHVLGESGIHVVRPGVELLVAPWSSNQPPSRQLDRLAAEAEPITAGAVRIGVGHGGIDRLVPQGTEDLLRLELFEQAVRERRIDLVCLGDRHSLTNVGDTGRIWYSGTPETTRRDEVKPGYVAVVELTPNDAPKVTPHRVGTWTIKEREFPMSDAESVAQVLAWLDDFEAPERTVAKPILKGMLSLTEHNRLTEEIERRALLFAAIPSSGRTALRPRADVADFSDLDLTGFVKAAAEELGSMDTTASANALALLVRLQAEVN
ncbi:DNA repair exonuclease [Actinospica sp. MGRD01-02]|uniref:Nuclease SbcCD subunit D n=1 Tax=Actinospica acidithermotolerans TaxID=2828514 RepID=A0A941IGY8_9ACTN|nr:DNA repair exonuclease [Actinospica acidithermotolerans]MBR7826649.1 DNA repair exonuclease [Actinospica acidithermotolerans]